MIENSVAHSARTRTAGDRREDLEHVGSIVARSTRHLVTEVRFAGILEEDFGIDAADILKALEGEPRRQAIEICAWAEKTDEPARALENWSKKHKKGSHRPRRSCAGCGGRFRGRELVEVGDDSLTYFEGDELCGGCAREHDIL